MNLRALHVFRTYIPDTKGGAQEVIRQICLSTAPYGVESRVFTPSPSPHPKMVTVEGSNVYRVKLNFEIASCGFCFTGLNEFRRQVEWADVVHYHFPWPFADVLHFAGRVRKPTLVTYHSDIVRQQNLMRLYNPLMVRFLDSVDHIVCTSENYRDTSDQLLARKEKVSVIPIGLDPASYPDPSAAVVDKVRKQYGKSFFFFVGMLRYYKGLHVLLDACVNQNFQVVIAGIGPLETELKQQAKQLGLTNVVFAGEVTNEEKAALLTLCRGVVFPSYARSEAFGVTLLEGALYGKPLVTAGTDTGVSYVNRNNETGLVVAAQDPAALADAISRLDRDEALREQLGKGARERFESLFTASVMGERYAARYRLLAGRS